MLELNDTSFQVIGVGGDTLGGCDVDEVLLKFIVKREHLEQKFEMPLRIKATNQR